MNRRSQTATIAYAARIADLKRSSLTAKGVDRSRSWRPRTTPKRKLNDLLRDQELRIEGASGIFRSDEKIQARARGELKLIEQLNTVRNRVRAS